MALFTNGGTISKTFAYDHEGRVTVFTNTLGKVVLTDYDARGLVTNVVHSAGTTDTAFTHDEYGNVVRAIDTAGNEWRYAYADDGVLTNEVQMIGGHTNVIERFVDEWRRPAGYALCVDGSPKGLIRYAYDEEGRIAAIAATNSAGRGFTVAYTNSAGYNYGYALTTANGDVLRRIVERDPYRRELTRNCTTTFNDTTVAEFGYLFDAGGRPVSRNDDTFAYNDRDEVIASTIGTNVFAHVYDTIGNHVQWSGNYVTNLYANNNLNQTVEQVSLINDENGISETTNAFTWAAAGGLQTDGKWLYEFDAEDRLASVTSAALTNGAIRVVNTYDYRHRRIGKDVYSYHLGGIGNEPDTTEGSHWQLAKHHDFVYDDWNLIHETVTTIDANATTNISETEYFWGPDLSGTLQGAGGVGGLMTVLMGDDFYFPVYDNNGNVVKYFNELGTIVAMYDYNDFGRTLSSGGSMSDKFALCFSTKYNDFETCLYYYGYRFYSVRLMRWLNRDPILELGGLNFYLACANNLIDGIDATGLKWKIQRVGLKRAFAEPCLDSDTFADLAQELHLDVEDYLNWAQTLDSMPIRGKRYLIPNTVYYHTGKQRLVDWYTPFSLFSWLVQESIHSAQLDRLKGFYVVEKSGVSADDIKGALRDDDVYKYIYMGHGEGAYINTEGDDPVAPGRYTKFGIADLELYSCESASRDYLDEKVIIAQKRVVWRRNVAASGKFIGFKGSADRRTYSDNLVKRGGMNGK